MIVGVVVAGESEVNVVLAVVIDAFVDFCLRFGNPSNQSSGGSHILGNPDDIQRGCVGWPSSSDRI
jgi:hypothetical protein